MMTRWILAVFLVAAGLGTMACGGRGGEDSQDGGIDAATSIPPEEYWEAYLRYLCESRIDCGVGFYASRFEGSVESCAEQLGSWLLGAVLQDVQWALEAGHLQYDEEAAAQCLADQRALGCDYWGRPWPDSCDEVFQGLLGAGETCIWDKECEGGWCDTRSGCPGTCAVTVGLEEACDPFEDNCEPELTCVEETCVAYEGPLAEGAACQTWPDWCAYPLHCDDQNLVCAQGGPEGTSCSWDNDCELGLFCNDIINGVCTTVHLVKEQGAACSSIEGRFCDGASGLVCVIDLSSYTGTTCEPAAQLGEACIDSQAQLHTPCDPLAPIFCESASETCQAMRGTGEPCQDYDECQTGWCDSTLDVCSDHPTECW